jgi:Tetratricopeptide repeat
LAKGDLERARAEFLALRQKAEEAGDHGMVAITTINLGEVAARAGQYQTALDYSEAAVVLFREVADDGGVGVSLEACGWNALALSHPAKAQQAFRDSLVIFDRLGSLRRTAMSALGIGAALVAEHKEERGVRLLAAAASLRKEFGLEFGDEIEEAHHRAVADAKASLGEEVFGQAWAAGEVMTPPDLVASAQAEATADSGAPAIGLTTPS